MKYLKSSLKPKKLRFLILRRVVGNSMSPTLTHGQLILASGLIKPKLNSLVLVSHSGLEKVKRLKKMDKNRVYILGDNPAASSDSKDFGWIPASSIIASVIWPSYKQKS